MATPLRPSPHSEQGSQGPEGLFISALLEIGEFTPAKYHVDDEDVEAWRNLWSFCCEYQTAAGIAPPVSLVRQRFRDFTLTKDVDPTWAAYNLSMAAANRRLRMRIQETIKLLGDDDVPGAYSAIESLRRPRTLFKEPADVFDHATTTEEFPVSRIEVPYPSLGRATGGIGPGEYWVFAARLGHGKTWVLTRMMARAAQCGYAVAYASLEMTAAAIARRLYLHLAGHDRALINQLFDDDPLEQKRAIDAIKERVPGSIKIYDPSHGRINTTSSIASMAHDYELLGVDHAGLLMTADGKRAIEDWRVQATISNVMREITLESGCPIAAAVQINREGVGSSGSRRAPGTDKLAGSDALGQDADVVVTGKRTSERTMVMSAEKTRHGPGMRWYTEFDPGRVRFEEISKERANELIMLDNDTTGDFD